MPLAFLARLFHNQIATSTFSFSFKNPNPQAVVVVVRALVVIAGVVSKIFFSGGERGLQKFFS
jgi:hypothetical protein